MREEENHMGEEKYGRSQKEGGREGGRGTILSALIPLFIISDKMHYDVPEQV